MAVSVDGVLAPIEGGNSPTTVRSEAAQGGRVSKGPAGYREMGCASLAFCDAQGDLISAIRFGRAPESTRTQLEIPRKLSSGEAVLANIGGSALVTRLDSQHSITLGRHLSSVSMIPSTIKRYRLMKGALSIVARSLGAKTGNSARRAGWRVRADK